jgi:hypothetical protein
MAIEDHEGGEDEIPLFKRMTSRNKIEYDFDDTQQTTPVQIKDSSSG